MAALYQKTINPRFNAHIVLRELWAARRQRPRTPLIPLLNDGDPRLLLSEDEDVLD